MSSKSNWGVCEGIDSGISLSQKPEWRAYYNLKIEIRNSEFVIRNIFANQIQFLLFLLILSGIYNLLQIHSNEKNQKTKDNIPTYINNHSLILCISKKISLFTK